MFEIVENMGDAPARIKVIGVGGAGGNAVNMMVTSSLKGVEFIAANTDAQVLKRSECPLKIQLGVEITRGYGAGSNPEVGRNAALESKEEIQRALTGADMIFIAAGMGGGTGTGAGPVVAEIAKDLGALTVAVVTKPFFFEGKKKDLVAEKGIEELRKIVDTLIVIPNERLVAVAGRNMSFIDARKKADEILLHAVKGISDLIIVPGLINLDFADIRTIMTEMGLALMGTGVATGENRAVEAAQRAISSPLLEDNTIHGARGILMNITGGSNMTLFEVKEAATLIQNEAHEEANIIFGTVIDDSMGDEIRLTVIATGFDRKEAKSGEITSIPHITPFSRGDLSRPTFLRNEKKAEKATIVKMGLIDDDDMGEFEIPTFLRKQAD
ncbi:MAG TPA: cell division protein FtsZ [Syntrophales bacterium]|nr:cell division protein FtsZ [Syntrophales bacterium]